MAALSSGFGFGSGGGSYSNESPRHFPEAGALCTRGIRDVYTLKPNESTAYWASMLTLFPFPSLVKLQKKFIRDWLRVA
jgi:hypothetical protein